MEPGYSVEMIPASADQYTFPGKEGSFWKSKDAEKIFGFPRTVQAGEF